MILLGFLTEWVSVETPTVLRDEMMRGLGRASDDLGGGGFGS